MGGEGCKCAYACVWGDGCKYVWGMVVDGRVCVGVWVWLWVYSRI